MAQNYVLLETIELTQSASSVNFDNIPQTGYTDLKIVIGGRTNRSLSVDGITIRFNNDTSAGNYSGKRLYGDGSTAPGSDSQYAALPFMDAANSTVSTFGNAEFYVPNYTGSTQKTFIIDGVGENNATTVYAGLGVGLWAGTSAVHTITIYPEAGTAIIAGSTFSLYGLAALGTTPLFAPKADGGDIVVNDGTYWYHAFLGSGLFTAQTTLSCDVLTIAGGGGGSSGGGGGGAGGLIYASSNNLTANNYSVTVGAGGSGAFENKGTNGSNSQFGTLTAAVGGGTGGTDYIAGVVPESGELGGSGGGNSQNPTGGGTFGLGTVGQGNNGGNSSTAGPAYGGGGGGGAGAVGGTGTSSFGGNGGAGLSTYSSWGSATLTGQNVSGTYWFAGGGAGGANSGGTAPTGGNGGGGNGGLGTAQPGTAALRNTGGGGGASSGGAGGGTSAAGGSGIVIIRYPMA